MKSPESQELLDVLHEPRVHDILQSNHWSRLRLFSVDGIEGEYFVVYNMRGPKVGPAKILRTHLTDLMRRQIVLLVVDTHATKGALLRRSWIEEMDNLFTKP